MDGYIKFHRKILDNPIVCKDAAYFAVWGYLLLNATHRDYQTVFKSEKVTLHPGQLITGRKEIAKKFKVDESKVQRILKKLEIEHQIEQQTCNENRLITILNWSEYQSSEQPIEQPVNNECTTDEQRVNTNKNYKNVRNNTNNIPDEYQRKYQDGSFELKCVAYLISSIKTEMESAKVPTTNKDIDKWCDHIEKMHRIDKYTEDDIYKTLVFARTDSFWKINIRSTSKFREKYETLFLQMKNKGSKEQLPKAQQKPSNKQLDFPQRTYSPQDMADLERKLLNKNL